MKYLYMPLSPQDGSPWGYLICLIALYMLLSPQDALSIYE